MPPVKSLIFTWIKKKLNLWAHHPQGLDLLRLRLKMCFLPVLHRTQWLHLWWQQLSRAACLVLLLFPRQTLNFEFLDMVKGGLRCWTAISLDTVINGYFSRVRQVCKHEFPGVRKLKLNCQDACFIPEYFQAWLFGFLFLWDSSFCCIYVWLLLFLLGTWFYGVLLIPVGSRCWELEGKSRIRGRVISLWLKSVICLVTVMKPFFLNWHCSLGSSDQLLKACLMESPLSTFQIPHQASMPRERFSHLNFSRSLPLRWQDKLQKQFINWIFSESCCLQWIWGSLSRITCRCQNSRSQVELYGWWAPIFDTLL